MIKLKFSKPSQLGQVNMGMKIDGRLIYYKFNNSPEANQLINALVSKGAIIDKGSGWIRGDIFSNAKSNYVKLGDFYIDLDEDSLEIIEEKLSKFYIIHYIKQGFKLET